MPFFTSPPLTVNDVFEWVNGLFGGRIPTLPLPSNWGAALRKLWNTYVIGDLPAPDEPKPWRIDIEGTWRPFSSCEATFQCMSIVVYDAGTIASPAHCSPGSPSDFEFEPQAEPPFAPPKRRKKPTAATHARAPAKVLSSPSTSPARGKKRRKP